MNECMLDLEGQQEAVTLAVYHKENGKPYAQTLKDFINNTASLLSEDDALQLLIFACSAKGALPEAKQQAQKILDSLD